MNISIINCTPHPIRLDPAIFGTANVFSAGLSGVHLETDVGSKTTRRVLSPSGIRLAARAVTFGPKIGCTVRYQPTEEAIEEMRKLKLIFSACQGSRHIVIASEISCRTMQHHVFDESSSSQIELMWPVLAQDSLRLPMAERWADRLATLPASEHT